MADLKWSQDIKMIFKSKNILVVAAHPDDEVLGCGATIAKHVLMGDEVHVVILAEGVTSRDQKRARKKRKLELTNLAKHAKKAKDILGVKSLILYNFPDNQLDSITLLKITKVIEKHLVQIKPEIVYTHHSGDVNIDHRQVHDAVITACRPYPSQTVKTLLFFEVPSSTDWNTPSSRTPFSPDWFVDVTETLLTKTQALEAYRSEMRQWPHSRSYEAVEHLARLRGSSVGVEAAEAFVLGRTIIG